MKMLSLECSTSRRSVALLSDGRVVFEGFQPREREDRTLVLIEGALREEGWRPDEIDSLAVGLGPGSYTGVRSSIATAIGWNLAHGTLCHGLSSLEAVAEQCRREGVRGQIGTVADAQRGEFHFGLWQLDDHEARCTAPLKIEGMELLKRLADEGVPLFGPDLPAQASWCRPAFPSASTVALLGSKQPCGADPSTLTPMYLRETAFVRAPAPRFPMA